MCNESCDESCREAADVRNSQHHWEVAPESNSIYFGNPFYDIGLNMLDFPRVSYNFRTGTRTVSCTADPLTLSMHCICSDHSPTAPENSTKILFHRNPQDIERVAPDLLLNEIDAEYDLRVQELFMTGNSTRYVFTKTTKLKDAMNHDFICNTGNANGFDCLENAVTQSKRAPWQKVHDLAPLFGTDNLCDLS